MIIMVAGGRNYTRRTTIREELRVVAVPDNVLITGAGTGCDTIAESIWRDEFRLPYIGIPANWHKYGRGAGPVRTKAIITGKALPHVPAPDVLILFPGGAGTKRAEEYAKEEGIDIWRVKDDDEG